jgi:hypothetical protein
MPRALSSPSKTSRPTLYRSHASGDPRGVKREKTIGTLRLPLGHKRPTTHLPARQTILIRGLSNLLKSPFVV